MGLTEIWTIGDTVCVAFEIASFCHLFTIYYVDGAPSFNTYMGTHFSACQHLLNSYRHAQHRLLRKFGALPETTMTAGSIPWSNWRLSEAKATGRVLTDGPTWT